MSVLDPFQLIIGFDTEYVRVSEKDNRIVSYQFALFNPRTGKRASGLITPNGSRHHHRFSLGGCLGRVLAFAEEHGFVDTEDGRLPPKVRILIVAFFSRADLPSFRDFRKLKRRFTILRGTYATTERPAIFDVQVMHGRRRRVSVTLCDTRLIAPASAGSMKALGELLGFPKLSVPDVIDEKGDTVAGITRMDLVYVQHPDAFSAYAVRDAEIAVEWLLRFARFADRWKLDKLPPTIAAMGVAKLRSFAEKQLPSILGKTVNKLGRLSDTFLPEALAIQGIAADAYRGGRNECYGHGLHRAVSADRPIQDFDLKSAYVNAMAPNRAIDWAGIERTTNIERLAVLDTLTVAAVDFEFPPGTRFPSLPVHDRKHGLIYPLKGSTIVPGPELVVALSQGAVLRARVGYVIPWLDPVAADADLPFVEFARIINSTRKRYPKGLAEELMAKEAGNSLYGKTAQAVGNMKTVSEGQRIFDTRDGASKPLPPSKITSPLIAAYTSGLTRAVISEILGNLPAHVRVFSATTDGWLSDCTPAEARAAASGPVATYFAALRGQIDPDESTEILEVKHRAAAVLVAKTRHAITVEPAAPRGDTIDHAYMLARGGHHLEREFDFDPGNDESKRTATREEATELIELWHGRTYETKLPQRNFISPRDQWQSDGDLTDKVRLVRVSLDYDFKREPVDVVEIDGVLNFTTRPWADIDAFKAARGNLDSWIESRGSVLKNMRDWIDFQAWSGSPSMRSAGRRTPYQQAILVAWAKGMSGFPIRAGKANKGVEPTLADVADILIGANVPDVTRDVLMNARRRAPDPIGSVAALTETDRETRQLLRSHLSDEALDSVLSGRPKKASGNGTEKPHETRPTGCPKSLQKVSRLTSSSRVTIKQKWKTQNLMCQNKTRMRKMNIFNEMVMTAWSATSCVKSPWGDIQVTHEESRGKNGAKTVVLEAPGRPRRRARKGMGAGGVESGKKVDADDLPGGEIARWAASRIGDGLRGRKAVVITREEADVILKAARAAASPWQKRQPLKPAFDVARSDAAIRKRLAVYQARLDRLARKGRPPSLLLARSISRDVSILEKYQRRWFDRHRRFAAADRPDFNLDMFPSGDPRWD